MTRRIERSKRGGSSVCREKVVVVVGGVERWGGVSELSYCKKSIF